MELTLDCQKRTPGAKPKAMRREGLLPAALYGHDGANSVELAVDAKTMDTLMRQASSRRPKIQLNVTDMPWNGEVFVQEVQTHPWKGTMYHVSFFAGKE
jgi:large subunit ribosomal protein L25